MINVDNMNSNNTMIDFNQIIQKLIANQNWDSNKPILTSEEAQKLYCDNTYLVLYEICCTYLNENKKCYIYNFHQENYEVSSYITDQNIFIPRNNIIHTHITNLQTSKYIRIFHEFIPRDNIMNNLQANSYMRIFQEQWYMYTIRSMHCYLELFDEKCNLVNTFRLYQIEDLDLQRIDFLVPDDRAKIESILYIMQMY